MSPPLPSSEGSSSSPLIATPSCASSNGSRPAVLNTNDVNEEKRPATCGVMDSGRGCPSQLHGSINFLMQEAGTPTGMQAVMTREEMRGLWLDSDWPPAFEARSPRHCADKEDLTAEGCSACLDLVGDAVAGSVEAQRYCRCVLAKRLSREEMHRRDP